MAEPDKGAAPDPAPTAAPDDADPTAGADPDLGGDSTGGEPAAETELAEELFAEEAGVPASSEPAPEDAGDPRDPVARERDDYREALQRLQADFENYKKRVTKQTEELRDRAAETLVLKLLPVLDTADLALSHGGGEDVKQLSSSLFTALEREGLEKIDLAGEAFDPTLHDAVAHEPGDGDGGQEVSEVLRAGYRWRGRVLRAAMVKVRG